VTFANPLPWWALAGILAALAALAWLAYRHAAMPPSRRALLTAIRFCTLLVLVLLLMRPVAQSGDDAAADAVVPILVDTSRSMAIEDANGARRIDRAQQIISSELLPALTQKFQTEVLAFGEAVTPSSPSELSALGRRSDLTGALRAVAERYRGRAIAGIVLISDGGDTGGSIDRDAPDAPAPVFPIGVGSTNIARDREVLSVTVAEAVLDDSRVDLAVSAIAHGYGTAPIELRLLENGRPIDVRRSAPAADGTPVREVFHLAPGKGAPTVYTVEIPATGGELVAENNVRSVLVQPPARHRRVLLVQGAPGFEHSFLRRAWSGDGGLEVDSVVRKGKNEQGSDTFYIQAASTRSAALASGYPSTRDELFAYDAIVLANMEGAVLTTAQLEATRDFVGRRGGGLLVLGAHSFLRRGLIDTPLEELLPLDVGERGRGVIPASVQGPRGANRVALTAAGEAHPIMQLTGALEETRKRWEAVPALAAVSPLGAPRPGAAVLAIAGSAGGTPRALVAVQRYGEGRTMAFTGEAAWRWRMLLPADDRSYDTFWRQAVRWLALPAADPVTVHVPTGAAPGDPLVLRVTSRNRAFEPLRDASVAIRVTAPDGRIDTVPATVSDGGEDGIHVARYRPEQVGVHRVVVDVTRPGSPAVSASSSMLVGGADPEMTDPRLNVRVLQRLAAASGGRTIDPGQIGTLAADLRAALPAAALLVRRDLWHNGWSFAIVVALLTVEWLFRRRWGMR
jgi:uncharacterized membrane protein